MRPALIAFVIALSTPAQAAQRPRLAVLVIFDQLRAAELERYAPFFGPKSFGGLDGARFDAVYSYAGTETGPGHATIATGANPSAHGIAINWWFEGGKKRYVVEDDRYPTLRGTDDPPSDKGPGGRSPASLAAPTLGDTMKNESAGRAKVVALSLKDRAAIIPAGKGGDIAVWYEPQLQRFTSSKAYVDVLPRWLDELGAKLPREAYKSGRWSPLPIPPELAWLAPVDDREGEGSDDGLERTFPHDLLEQPELLRPRHYRSSPQSISDLFNLALAAVDAEQLGVDDEPDLLIVSVSTTDYVGHNFGPDSLEQLDMIRRADRALRRFLDDLGRKLPPRSFVVAVTGDHGAPPLPLPALKRRGPNGIVLASDIDDAAEKAARAALPNDPKKRFLGFAAPQIFLDLEGLAPEQQRKLLDAVAGAVAAIEGIASVLDATKPRSEDADAMAPLMRASAFPGRHGQLFVRQDPRVVFLINREKRGTDHGTPYLYDRRVPFLLAGPGVRRGRYAQPVDPRDIAPTLAFLLGVPPPDMCEGKPVPAVGDDVQ